VKRHSEVEMLKESEGRLTYISLSSRSHHHLGCHYLHLLIAYCVPFANISGIVDFHIHSRLRRLHGHICSHHLHHLATYCATPVVVIVTAANAAYYQLLLVTHSAGHQHPTILA
jgi:hypothetical protein